MDGTASWDVMGWDGEFVGGMLWLRNRGDGKGVGGWFTRTFVLY